MARAGLTTSSPATTLSWIDIGYEVNECAREGRSLAEFHRWMHREYGASFDHVHDEHGQLRRQVPTGP